MPIPQAIVSEPAARKGSGRGNSHAVMSIPQASVSKPVAWQGIQKGELTRCHVNPPGGRQRAGSAARNSERRTHELSCKNPPGERQQACSAQGIRKGKLTSCRVNPPGERQQAGSATGGSEVGAHILSCQSPRRSSASRQRGKASGSENSHAVMPIPQAIVSKPAARQRVWTWELTCCHVNPPGER